MARGILNIDGDLDQSSEIGNKSYRILLPVAERNCSKCVSIVNETMDEMHRRIQNAEYAAEREKLLNKLGSVVRTSLDVEAIKTTASRGLGALLDADRCYFVSYDLYSGMSQVEHDWFRQGLKSIAGDYRIPTHQVEQLEYYHAGTRVIPREIFGKLPDPAPPSHGEHHPTSIIHVPLIDQGQLVAALVVAMEYGARGWTAEDVALVETVSASALAGIAACRSRLRERNIAATLQEALLPPIPESISGLGLTVRCKPALREANVGGDFYDFFALDQNTCAFVLGDVMGKGLDAAKQVAMLRNTVRYSLYRNRDLVQSVTELNRIIFEHRLLISFASLFIGLYEADTQFISYISCGHEPAIIRRKSTGRMQLLLPTGPLLGVTEKLEFMQEQTRLDQGDALIVYTDGLTEAGRRRQEMLGVSGVIALLSTIPIAAKAEYLAQHLLESAEEFAGGPLEDDVCLLVATVQ